MMPGKDGFETLGELRQFTQAPVIMLTARSEEYDKLFGNTGPYRNLIETVWGVGYKFEYKE